MEMANGVGNNGQLFSNCSCVLKKLLETDYSSFFLGEVTKYSPPGALRTVLFESKVYRDSSH